MRSPHKGLIDRFESDTAHHMEIWKPILGYDGRYEISNHGRVRSWAYKSPRFVTPASNGIGYYQFRLFRNGKAEAHYAHRLVATYFVDGYEDGMEVDHIDNDKSNNNADNLRWISRRENMLKCHSDNPHILEKLNERWN